ncbi:MAG: hypothetical protein M0P69_01680 [Bacteroidales bacterium]|nr:hypothetical protein [Bacteroidales bacterium]
MESLHNETRHGLKIEIFLDEVIDGGPDDWEDDGLFLVFYHRDFNICRDKIVTKNELIDHFYHDKKIDAAKDYHIFPASALIHGGVTVYIGKHDHQCDPGGWDSSFCGAVLISKKEFRTRMQAQKAADGLISTWNDYLSGNVYGYQITDAAGNDVDSCWGYYGDYDADGGALQEARALVDHMTKAGAQDHTGQLLFDFC